MGKRSIEPYVRAQAVALYQLGLNLSKISKQLQVCRRCVLDTITKFEEYTKFDDMKRSGRPKSLSDGNIRELKRLVQRDNRLSAVKIATDLNISLFKPMSKRTVRRYLKKLGYEYAVKIKKQWLSTKHRKDRIRWCERYQHCTFKDWWKVTFSDESIFYVLKRKNQVKIWRTDDERLLPDCIQQMNTGNSGKVGIWGGISGDGTTAARIFEGTMNETLYCDVLQQEMTQSMRKLPSKSAYTFQQIWRLGIRQNSSKKKWQNWSWTYWNGHREVRISIQLRCCGPSWIRNWLPNPYIQ